MENVIQNLLQREIRKWFYCEEHKNISLFYHKRQHLADFPVSLLSFVTKCCLIQPKYKLALSHPMLSRLIPPYCKPRWRLLVCILFKGWPQSVWQPSLLWFAQFDYEIIFRYFTYARGWPWTALWKICLTLRRLMSYIYIYGTPILDVSRSHTTTQHSR